MNPAAFAYERPESLSRAIALLQAHGENAKLIAGGHSLLPIMKLRLAEPEWLIDIGRLPELRGVRESADSLAIGALTTHTDVATDPAIAARIPLLSATAARVGDQQVRNRGTLGGALAHADAASDYPAAVLALEATIIAEGPGGERRIPAGEFFVDFLTTALDADEVLTAIEFPVRSDRPGWSYQKLANQASGYAIVGVAALVSTDAGGVVTHVRIGVTGAAAVPWRAESAENSLLGQQVTDAAARAAAAVVDDGFEALDDLHGSADYRRRVTRGLTHRAILEAASRTGS